MSRPTDATSRLSQATPVVHDARGTVISRELYRPGPLQEDLLRLASPATRMLDADILSFLLKYFYAILYPGSETHPIALEEISLQLGRLYDLWAGISQEEASPVPGDYNALALRMLCDLPRTAHIFRAVANRPLPPAQVEDPFLGIDCGTGSGILLTAAWFQAKRNGVRETQLYGLELDAGIARRTQQLFNAFGLGRVLVEDARNPAVYTRLPDGPVAFVANENLAAPKARLTAEPFCAAHDVLFTMLSSRLKNTLFFPEALVVRGRDATLDVVLSKNNRFQIPRHYRHKNPRPRSIVIEGRLTRLWQVGRQFRKYVPETWLSVMPVRW